MQRIKSGNIQKCDQLCYSVRYMSTVFIPESHFLTKTMTKVYEDQTGKNGDEIQWKIKYKWAQTMHWEVRENDRDRYGKWHARKKHTHITFMIKCSVQLSLDLDCPIRGNWVEGRVWTQRECTAALLALLQSQGSLLLIHAPRMIWTCRRGETQLT